MIITLSDGQGGWGYDVGKRKTVSGLHLKKHCLRYHVYDERLGLAVKKFSTADRSLQDDILAEVAKIYGVVDNSNTWIRPRIKRRELWPLGNEPRMVLRDLRAYWGDDVSLRGTSKRYIYYLSDGAIENTPDAIGLKFGAPLIYEGYAMATIFNIKGLDPLSSDGNIVYWLTEPMWKSFHVAKRHSPKEFPWPTGFLATKWCQRDGFSRYRNGISLASMSQGQTVGTWSVTSLPRYWREHQRQDIFAWKTKTYDTKPTPHRAHLVAMTKQIDHYAKVQSGCEFALAGITCPDCGTYLKNKWRECSACHKQFSFIQTIACGLTYCTACGKRDSLCSCGENAALVTMTHAQVERQLVCINSKFP